MLHSIYDLTTFCRKTSGDVPAKLVGASTTVVGSKMYLFGGRLVSERRMVSDMYVFDLDTLVWDRVPVSSDDDLPRPRYFHSTDIWNNMLIVFGGMSNNPDSANPEDLCVLNDVRFFDISSRHWLPQSHPPVPVPDSLPRARYAHLSSVTANRLFVIGGQDFNNTWLDDVCVYDLVQKSWLQRRDYPRHCGTYRSVAVSSDIAVRLPQDELRISQSASTLGPPGQRFGPDRGSSPSTEFTPTESLVHLPYSAPPTEDHPADIFLYSNYNFTDVKRELEVFSPLPDGDFTIQDKSTAMAGTTFPPGLRFPTGAILGTNLIIAGTYLAHSYQSFSIWVLDLISMTWSRIDPGKAVETGSWFRGSLWAEANKFIIFGNKNGNLVDDYNRRLLSWEHVAVVDLEAFGIYQPPPLKLDITMQELGLATLEERVVADFEIVCEDGRRLPCSRRILEERWPWFLEQRKRFAQNVNRALENLPDSVMHVPVPELPGNASSEDPILDPRLTSRSLHLSEPYPITLALLQYFYTTALVTPLQHAPAVLSQLLVLALNYKLNHLEVLVKHAMHRALSNSTSVGVYEVATLCSCRSLQIRALRTVMSYTTNKRPSRSRDEKPPGSSGGGGGGGGPVNGTGNNDPNDDSQYLSRPRGTSDARWRSMGGEANGGGSGYNTRALKEAYETNMEHFSTHITDLQNLSDIWDHDFLERGTATTTARTFAESAYPMDLRRMGIYSPDCAESGVGTSFMQLNDVTRGANDDDKLAEEDQITPLPVLGHTKPLHRSRHSVVSMHTETEIHALADLMSDFADLGSSSNTDQGTGFSYSSEPREHIPSARNEHASTSSPKFDSSFGSVATLAYSDSEHYSDGYADKSEHSVSSSSGGRGRRLRILTDSTRSKPPSLTSSASYSSLSTGRYTTSPSTPLNPPAEFPALTESPAPDLGIIDEQANNTTPDNDIPDDINDSGYSSYFVPDPHSHPHHHSVKQWPQQRSNIHWIPPPPPIPPSSDHQPHSQTLLRPMSTRTVTAPSSIYLTNASTEDNLTITPPASESMSMSMSMTSLSTTTAATTSPRTPGSFVRLLRRKKSEIQDGQFQYQQANGTSVSISPKEEKKKKKIKEKKIKPETPEQRRERILRERLQDSLGVHPVVMGGMMALG